MINAIHSLSSTIQLNIAPPKQTAIDKLFHLAVGDKKPPFTLKPLLRHPGQAVFGAAWVAFWGYSVYQAASSALALRREILAQPRESFAKIGSAAKKALLGQLSFVGSSAFLAYWAHETRLISLGRYTDLFNTVYYGSSLVSNGIEGAAAAYDMYVEDQAVLQATTPRSQEEHRNKYILAFLKLASNVAMVAWAALGIVTIAAGVAFSAWISLPLVGVGLGFAILSIAYEIYLDQVTPPPITLNI